jgi:hypothetical protein
MKHLNRKTRRSLLLVFSLAFFQSVQAQEPFFSVGYGYSLGKVRDLNQMLYMHNLRNNTDKQMRSVNGGHGLTFAVGLEEDIGVELKWSNSHFSRRSTFQEDGANYRQDLRIRRNGIDLNFYVNLDGEANLGVGVDYSRMSARSRKYGENSDPSEYIEFIKVEGESFSGFTGGISVFGTYHIAPMLSVRATYRFSFNGTSSNGLSQYLNAGTWATTSAGFSPEFKWSTLRLEILFTIGGDR